MSSADAFGPATPEARRGLWERLPGGLRPRPREPRETRWQRPLELALLIVVGLVLTIATLNDVAIQVGKDNRFSADVRTWRAHTGHDYKNITTESGEENGHGTRDIACANTSAGPPDGRTQLCLVLTGPVHHSLRTIDGGYYIPAYFPNKAAHRYGCFGTAVGEGLCQAP